MTTTKTLILEAYSQNEYGDSPSWAKWELTADRLDRIEYISELCLQRKFHSITAGCPVDEWHRQGDLRLRGDELHISGSSLWFTCYRKHANYQCETRIMELSDLQKLMLGAPVDEFIVEGALVFQNETAKEAYTEHLADQTEGVDG